MLHHVLLTTAGIVAFFFFLGPSSAGNFSQEVKINEGGPRAEFKNDGQVLTLSLVNKSGSGFESYSKYTYGRFDVDLKLSPGNSAGTVVIFCLATSDAVPEEIHFQFHGNSSGQPYTIETNVYSGAYRYRKQEFRPWFDPTADFHTYTIFWNSERITFMVDNVPIRVFQNYKKEGSSFPIDRLMKVYGNIWNVDGSNTPNLVATFQNYCVFSLWREELDGKWMWKWSTSERDSCNRNWTVNGTYNMGQRLDYSQWLQLYNIRNNSMIYDYCRDHKIFPPRLTRPVECKFPMYY